MRFNITINYKNVQGFTLIECKCCPLCFCRNGNHGCIQIWIESKCVFYSSVISPRDELCVTNSCSKRDKNELLHIAPNSHYLNACTSTSETPQLHIKVRQNWECTSCFPICWLNGFSFTSEITTSNTITACLMQPKRWPYWSYDSSFGAWYLKPYLNL